VKGSFYEDTFIKLRHIFFFCSWGGVVSRTYMLRMSNYLPAAIDSYCSRCLGEYTSMEILFSFVRRRR
jgi:hypothetical protein